ncbi:MFS transporter [Clostridium butyricum]|uniref:MFS transporter n=2 Tax=Clostridium butyricum TaxID=1492 RepID=UPI0002C95811|nr:MFS transporter [Clostridium butyricum]EMU52621.1 sugar transporter [Clostridium butyricum DKU-01]
MMKVAEKKKINSGQLSIFERFSYGFGDFGCNIIYTAMSVFLLKYYVDYAGVSAAAIGTIMLVSRVFDGVSDLIMGIIVDRTKTKYGKARPWILRMAIPFALSGVLLFAVPVSWGTSAKLVYVFITYNLVSTIIYTAINVPYSTLNALMTQDPYERSILSIYRNLLATGGTLIINSCTLRLVSYFGNNASAWTKAFVVFGTLALLAFFINFFGTKERVTVADSKKEATEVSIKEGFKTLFKNKYWIQVAILLVLIFIGMALSYGSTTFYTEYILGDIYLADTINSVMNLAQIVFMFLIAGFIKKLGKRNVMAIGFIITIFGTCIIAIPGVGYIGVMISSIIRGIGNACSGATMWAMLSDTIEYGEWKTGNRVEGLANSAASFGYKVGNGFGSALLGWILAFGGYIAQSSIQTKMALLSIRLVYIIIPISIYLIIIIILKFYNLDNEFDEIVTDLNKRR